MVVEQGDIFWADLGFRDTSEAAGRRPVLVVQCNLFNRTRINTIVVVPLTTNDRLRSLPGNVSFRRGEANLPRTCAANVTLVAAIDRSRLTDKIGRISQPKLDLVLVGLDLVLRGAASE